MKSELKNTENEAVSKNIIEQYLSDLSKAILNSNECVKLNDVLKWHSSDGRDKFSHFEVSRGEGFFVIYSDEETESIVWDLSKPNLSDQSEELIYWLEDLI